MAEFSRRAVLKGVGHAAAFGSLAAALPLSCIAQETEESAILLSLVYPNAPRAKFDVKRYRETHIPMLRSVYGDSVERVEARVPRKLPATEGGRRGSNVPQAAPQVAMPISAVLASTSVWIRDAQAFAEKSTAAQQPLADDLQKLTDIVPAMQYDRVVTLLGESRSAIEVGGQVFSTYFPTQQGTTFDARYFGEKVIPLMVKLYGSRAIRRIEYTLGQAQGGAEPALRAALHVYIRDRAVWDAASTQAFAALQAEAPNYTTVAPLIADTEVVAIA